MCGKKKKEKKTIYRRYLRSCKLTQVHAHAHVTRRRAVITYCKAVTHALHYFLKTDVLWAERQDGAIIQRSPVSQNKPKPVNDGERQKFRWEMIKEMVLLDGGATFLRGCQVGPDFSAYHNNKADEMPHIRCSTGYRPPPPPPFPPLIR